jgi:hypothetical protein
MREFDKASRYLAKQDPANFFRWLWRHAVTPLQFHSWLDARRLALPVESGRILETSLGGLGHAQFARGGLLAQ